MIITDLKTNEKSKFEQFLREKGYSKTGIHEMINRFDEYRTDEIDRYEIQEFRKEVGKIC